MDNATASIPDPADQLLTSLARINHRLALLRAWLSHDHQDEPFWWARRMTAPTAQRERLLLQRSAHLMHVERAASRGRIHCAAFADLEAERAWLAKHEAALARLRAGDLPL
jgi:hypothetical protein